MYSIGDVMMYVDKSGRNHFEEWYLKKLDLESQDLVREAIKQQLIVLLSGYNKGIDTSRELQSNEIERARKLLNDWREGNGRTTSASTLLS